MNTKNIFNYKLRILVKRTKKVKNMIKQKITLKKTEWCGILQGMSCDEGLQWTPQQPIQIFVNYLEHLQCPYGKSQLIRRIIGNLHNDKGDRFTTCAYISKLHLHKTWQSLLNFSTVNTIKHFLQSLDISQHELIIMKFWAEQVIWTRYDNS